VDPTPLKRNKKWTFNEKKICPTEDRFKSDLGSFMGWLTADPAHPNPLLRGKGFDPRALRLIQFTKADLMKAFLGEFLATRSQGFSHAVYDYVRRVNDLLRKTTGFIRQQPHVFVDDLKQIDPTFPRKLAPSAPGSVPAPEPDEEWFDRWCEAQRSALRDFIQHVEASKNSQVELPSGAVVLGGIRKLRDVEVDLKDVLDLPHPMQFVFELLRRFEREHTPPETAGEQLRAVFNAKRFTIAACTAIPLRVGSWTVVRREHFSKVDGRWGCEIPQSCFKNSAHLKQPYTAMVEDWATPIFDEYFDHTLDALLGGQAGSPHVMVDMAAGNPGFLSETALSNRVRNLSIELCGRSLGFHWQRHVAVTEYLKNHKDGFYVAAMMLNDTLETVMNEYGHLATKDHFRYWAGHVDQVWRMPIGEDVLKVAR
jgi:hypothetical protein